MYFFATFSSFQTDKFLSKHIIVEWREEQLTASWTVTTRALTAWKKIDVHLGEQWLTTHSQVTSQLNDVVLTFQSSQLKILGADSEKQDWNDFRSRDNQIVRRDKL